jgi:hypothetical protein
MEDFRISYMCHKCFIKHLQEHGLWKYNLAQTLPATEACTHHTKDMQTIIVYLGKGGIISRHSYKAPHLGTDIELQSNLWQLMLCVNSVK